MNQGGGPRARRWTAGAALAVLVALSLAMVLAPAWWIHPFRHQGERELDLAYRLRQWGPWALPAVTLIAVALAMLLWRGPRGWWRKSALAAAVVVCLAAAWLSRQNQFEWMFRPLPRASYGPAEKTDSVASDEMVLAVELNGDAVAYPVGQMAYHHLVQDVVGGVPIVATY